MDRRSLSAGAKHPNAAELTIPASRFATSGTSRSRACLASPLSAISRLVGGKLYKPFRRLPSVVVRGCELAPGDVADRGEQVHPLLGFPLGQTDRAELLGRDRGLGGQQGVPIGSREARGQLTQQAEEAPRGFADPRRCEGKRDTLT